MFKSIFATIAIFIASIFGGHQAAPPQPAAAVVAVVSSETPSASTTGTAGTQSSPTAGTTTIVNQYITQPVIEHTIQTNTSQSLSQLQTEIAGLQVQISQILSAQHPSYLSGAPAVQTFLGNTIPPVLPSTLRASDIPTDITAANYLPLAGGTLTGDLTLTGNLTVAGAQTLSGAITIPYLTATSTSVASSFQQLLVNGSTTLQNFTGFNATTTNATSTTLFATLGHFATGVVDTLTSTLATITNLIVTTITGTNATFTNATTTNATSTNAFATILTATNGTLTNATSTNFFATTASSTNLFAQAASLGALTANTIALTSALPLSSGGTGGTSTTTARSNLGLAYASSADITNNTNIATWGDSLTAGNEDGTGGTYPKSLQSLTGYNVYNGGVGAQTSTQIAARMLADTAKHSWPTIIWAGRNNYTDPTTVETDIASMVSALGTNQNYIILSILNGEYGSNEYVGGTGYNQIASINNYLASTYGTRYIDIRSYLVSLYNPGNSQDVIDHGHDIPPSSLRYNNIHLTAAGYADVAQKIYQNIALLQQATTTAITALNLPSLFGSPPTIGSVNQNAGYFSAIGIATTSPVGVFDVNGASSFHGIATLYGTYLQFRTSDGTGSENLFVSGNGLALQTTGSLITASDGGADLGYSSSLYRFRNLYLTGTANLSNLNATTQILYGTPTVGASLEIGDDGTNISKPIAVFGQNNSTGRWEIDNAGDPTSRRLLKGFSGTTEAIRFNPAGDSFLNTGGRLGIGTTTPWRTLSVTGTVGFDGLTGAFGAGSLCLTANKEVVYNSGSDSCLSSLRATKHDIQPLNLAAIDMVKSLQPVSFIYNNDASSTVRYGFIAEDTAAVDSHLGTYDQTGKLSGVDDRSILSIIVKALQELIATVQGFAQSITSAVGNFGQVNTNQLCVKKSDGTPVCITGDQLTSMLASTGQSPLNPVQISEGNFTIASSTTATSTSEGTTTPEIVTSSASSTPPTSPPTDATTSAATSTTQ